MRLALAAVLMATSANAQVGPPYAAICNKSFEGSTAAATTQVAAAATGQAVYVCGYDVAGGAAAGTFQIEYGSSGGSCATPTVLTPSITVAVGQFLSSISPYAGLVAPLGNALCVVTTGTGPTGFVIYYSQF
jgi:hypothetical protein